MSETATLTGPSVYYTDYIAWKKMWMLFIPYGSFLDGDSFDDDYICATVLDSQFSKLQELIPHPFVYIEKAEKLPGKNVDILNSSWSSNLGISAFNIFCDYGFETVKILFPEFENLSEKEFLERIKTSFHYPKLTRDFFSSRLPIAFRKMAFSIFQFELYLRGIYVNRKRQIEKHIPEASKFIRFANGTVTDEMMDEFERVLEKYGFEKTLKFFRKCREEFVYTHIELRILSGLEHLHEICNGNYVEDEATYVPEKNKLYVAVAESNEGYTSSFSVLRLEKDENGFREITIETEDGELTLEVEEVGRCMSDEEPFLDWCNTI